MISAMKRCTYFLWFVLGLEDSQHVTYKANPDSLQCVGPSSQQLQLKPITLKWCTYTTRAPNFKKPNFLNLIHC